MQIISHSCVLHRMGARRHVRLATALVAAGALAAPGFAPASVTCRLALDRGVLPADRPETTIVKVTLHATPVAPRERPPVNLAIAIDHSGSMAGEKIERAKEAAIEAIRHLGSRDTVAVVIYDHEVETLVPAQSASNIEWIEARIRDIRSRGNTALFGGVSQAASEVRKNLGHGAVNRVLLLSDGLANVGPASPDELGRLGAALMKEGIAVSTVGVGTDYNEDLMTRLSRQSDGNSYFAEKSGDLARIFSAELGEVLTVAATRVRLTIRFEDGATPVEIIGRDGRIDGQSVTVDLNQLYGGQEKYVLVRTAFTPGRDGTARPVATGTVRYEEAVERTAQHAAADVAVRFSRAEEEVTRNINVEVSRDYYVNANAAAVKKAVSLADSGKRAEAAQVLRESAVKLEAAAKTLNAPALAESMDSQRQQAAAIEHEGLSTRSRKVMVTDSYQVEMQQQAK